MIRRSAAPEWRWARAISPGMTIWMFATSVLLAMPGSCGLVRRNSRRSACCLQHLRLIVRQMANEDLGVPDFPEDPKLFRDFVDRSRDQSFRRHGAVAMP